jgi:hypothetical protein
MCGCLNVCARRLQVLIIFTLFLLPATSQCCYLMWYLPPIYEGAFDRLIVDEVCVYCVFNRWEGYLLWNFLRQRICVFEKSMIKERPIYSFLQYFCSVELYPIDVAIFISLLVIQRPAYMRRKIHAWNFWSFMGSRTWVLSFRSPMFHHWASRPRPIFTLIFK